MGCEIFPQPGTRYNRTISSIVSAPNTPPTGDLHGVRMQSPSSTLNRMVWRGGGHRIQEESLSSTTPSLNATLPCLTFAAYRPKDLLLNLRFLRLRLITTKQHTRSY